MTETPVRDKIPYTNRHLEFTMLLVRQQRTQGLYFLFDHPKTASSWQHPLVKQVQSLEGVITVECDLCAHGMDITHLGELWYAKKPTRFLTDSPYVAQRLRKSCPGDHSHINLYKTGKSKLTPVYPETLCRNIIKGLMMQMQQDGRVTFNIAGNTTRDEVICSLAEHNK